MALTYPHISSPRRFKRVVKSKSYYAAVEKQKKYLKSLGIDPNRKIDRDQFRAFGNWWESKEYQKTKEKQNVTLPEPKMGTGGTKPVSNYKLEESKKFTVAPAYNKGGYQVISKTNIKDIGR